MNKKIRIGLVGYGKAGYAVANIFSHEPDFELRWIVRGSPCDEGLTHPDTDTLIFGSGQREFGALIDTFPVDAIVDFSNRASLNAYGEVVRRRGIMLLSAISNYSGPEIEYARSLGTDTRVLCSPNITLGINFLIVASKLLRKIAPFADVEILEQHFREKPEISGTARRIADTLEIEDERITSLRLGGIVGHHEVIFGFPHQTVRLTHESIRREAFGTGATFALRQLACCDNGFYTFDEILQRLIATELLAA